MATINIETFISASAETCFDLIRDIRINAENNMQTSGLIGLGQTVTFEGSHFGIRQRLTAKVVEVDRPRLLVDEMIEGPFKQFKHIHEFLPHVEGTLIKDTLIWTSPFGILGRLVDKLLLESNLRKIVQTRNAKLKMIAEKSGPQSPSPVATVPPE